jgi:5'-methylthioadenosine nucleosidase
MPSSPRIALLVAMQAEAQPIIDTLDLKENKTFGDGHFPCRYFQGSLRQADGHEAAILLSLNGTDPRHDVDSIGTIPSALNAYITATRFRPDFLVSAGTAGGFASHGARMGEVFLSAGTFRFHDRRVAIPGFDRSVEGRFPSFDVKALAGKLGFRLATVSTGDSLDCPPEDLSRILKHALETEAEHAGISIAKEMEAAAIAYVAQRLKIPFFAIKSITDLVDSAHPTVEAFQRNLAQATLTLRDATVHVLKHLQLSPGGFSER